MKYGEILLKNLLGNQTPIGNIYFQLFSMIEKLDENLEYYLKLYNGEDTYFKEMGKTDWFYLFHKAIRQTDMYTNCYQKEMLPLLTTEEESEFRFLRKLVNTKDYNKRSNDKGELFTKEYNRFLHLYDKKRRELEYISINGKLDSILWNTIHMDKDNILQNALITTFEHINTTKKHAQIPG